MLLIKSLPISEQVFAKQPFSSDLGEKIVVAGIRLMDKLGLEAFTFKKLAAHIGSTEASIYRYFTNKHMFFVYASNLYWRWLESRIMQLSHEKFSHYHRLEAAIAAVVSPTLDGDESEFPYRSLVNIITSEGPKVYLTKWVDSENKEGVFLAYKSLCEALSQLILNVNPNYSFSHSLASTIIETAHDQLFFSQHLPRLTDIDKDNTEQLNEFLVHTVASALD